jgi:uncharacterized membrane protein
MVCVGSVIYIKYLYLDLLGRNSAWQWPMALAGIPEMLDGFSQFLQDSTLKEL